jgi:hypothetical protein
MGSESRHGMHEAVVRGDTLVDPPPSGGDRTAADDVWGWLVANSAGRDITVTEATAGSGRTDAAARMVLSTLVSAGLMERRLTATGGYYVYRWTRLGDCLVQKTGLPWCGDE